MPWPSVHRWVAWCLHSSRVHNFAELYGDSGATIDKPNRWSASWKGKGMGGGRSGGSGGAVVVAVQIAPKRVPLQNIWFWCFFFAPFYRTTRICMIYMLPFVLSTAIALTWSAAQLDRMHFSIHRSSWRIPPSHFTEGIGLGVQRDLPFLEGTYIAYQRAQHCEH